MKKTETIKIRTVVLAFLVMVAIVAVIGSVAAYAFPQWATSKTLRHMFPYPAIVVNHGDLITFSQVDANLKAIRRFYESQADDFAKSGLRIDFSTPEGQKRLMLHEKELLNKMVEDVVVETLAKERGITITQEMISKSLERKLKELGTHDDVEQRLQRLYGWSIADFEEKIVKPALYKDLLEGVFAQGVDLSTAAKQRINEAKKSLDGGMSFGDAAAKYSDGATAEQGGDLGWVMVSDLTPEIAEALKNQSLHRPTGVIESPLGFHIVLLEERKKDKTQGDMVRIKQIFSHKTSFVDWLTEQEKQQRVWVWFKGYHWDAPAGRIEFDSQDMKDFESTAWEQWSGDASLLF